MAMIQCPECGQKISDKAKKCIHCGKIVLEELPPTKFCAECGKEIHIDANECPFCGCPIKAESPTAKVIDAVKKQTSKNKKSVVIVSVMVLCLLSALVISKLGPSLNKYEKLAYQNIVDMREMMKSPDSFKLTGDIFIVEVLSVDGSVEKTYTVFDYGGTNSYGAFTRSQAVYLENEYVCDSDKFYDKYASDEENIERYDKTSDLQMYQLYVGIGEDTTGKYNTIEIDVSIIQEKLDAQFK